MTEETTNRQRAPKNNKKKAVGAVQTGKGRKDKEKPGED